MNIEMPETDFMISFISLSGVLHHMHHTIVFSLWSSTSPRGFHHDSFTQQPYDLIIKMSDETHLLLRNNKLRAVDT